LGKSLRRVTVPLFSLEFAGARFSIFSSRFREASRRKTNVKSAGFLESAGNHICDEAA